MPNLGVSEIVLILLVVLIFFGAKKIPELAQGLGKGLREFRKATREVQEDIESEARKLEDDPAKRDSSPKPKS
ncbi:MAG: twin-arginine translocase TatA/TatE family subunit [Bacteroidota bacterium]